MIIVRAQNGLGSQMYQYALYQLFLKRGKDCRVSLYYYKYHFHKRDNAVHEKSYLVDDVFGTKTILSTKQEDEKLGSIDIPGRILRRLGIHKKTYFQEIQYLKRTANKQIFNEKILTMDNVYLDGYWQSYHYLDLVDAELRQQFQFPKPLNEKNQSLLRQMQRTNSVSIHVRRNDYLAVDYFVNLGKDYYDRAMALMRRKVEKPVFFCFSDDIPWCRKNIAGGDIVYVDGNTGKNSYIDMQLMSHCKHNIIANSTFSFWGAWLNPNPGKCVIRPERFSRKGPEGSDRWPKEWLII